MELISFFTSRYSPSFMFFVEEQAEMQTAIAIQMPFVRNDLLLIIYRMSITSTSGCSSVRNVKKPLLIVGFIRMLSK